MRKNEYTSLEEFKSQYIGEWAPSEGHWYGLEFKYKGAVYRLNTGSMYEDEEDKMFNLYLKKEDSESANKEYELIGQYESMNELLNARVINNMLFRDVIMDDDTELIGQD